MMIGPEEQQIIDRFMKNMDYLMARFAEQNQASLHGESDVEFAQMSARLLPIIEQASRDEMTLFLQALFSAVVATVKEYQDTQST